MSFTPTTRDAHRSIAMVTQSLLQGEGLPFADVLTTEHIEQAFEAEGVAFGVTDAALESSEGLVYSMGVTLWAMLSQALFTDVQRACRAAVQRVAIYDALLGVKDPSTNTRAYCRARAKVAAEVVERLTVEMAEQCEAATPPEWRWKGLRTLLVDGTTFSMPDTSQNQAAYPQLTAQAEGLGFPLMRAIALTSLVTGMVLGMACGMDVGKQTGETALLRIAKQSAVPFGLGTFSVTGTYSCRHKSYDVPAEMWS